MPRLSPRLLLLSGILLVALRIVVPLSSSSPSQPPVAAPAVTVAVDTPPELEDVNREVERLRDRLTDRARATTPRRDPFRFADPVPSTTFGASTAAIDAILPAEPVRPAIAWPVLVAILSSGDSAAPVYRAVFEDAAGVVHVRSTGQSIGGVTVDAVTGDVVTVVHGASGESTQLTLR